MQIKKLSNLPSFARALPKSKKEDFKNTAYEAKKALGIEGGLSVLQIHTQSMPRQDFFDTGIGKLNSKSTLDFIDKITFYTYTNAIKEFPKGISEKVEKSHYCPYVKNATTFGDDTVNLLNIVQDKRTYGNILNFEDIGFLADNGSSIINYENEIAQGYNQPVWRPLKIAFRRFKQGYSTPELEQKFEEYKNIKRVKENYPRFALFPFIAQSEPEFI